MSDRPDITDAEKLDILRRGIEIDEAQIEQLVDAAAALYTSTGQFTPSGATVAYLWDVVKWHLDGRNEFEQMIEASTLGSPGAKALRARTPPEVVEQVLDALGREPLEDDERDEAPDD